MRFILLSDCHATDAIPVARLDNIIRTFDFKFSFVLDYAKRHRCIVLQAGDLSDKSRNWTILDYFQRRLKEYNVPFYSVFGQHDLYNRADPSKTPSTMLSLIHGDVLCPLSSKPTMIKDVCIVGANWGDEIPEGGISTKNILVLHAPISMKEEYKDQDFTHPRYFLRKHYHFDLVLVGDIHRAFKVFYKGRYVVNTGPMLRLEANEYNFEHKPHFYVWDSDNFSLEKVKIPHRPADEVLTREHIDEKRISKKELERFASSLKGFSPSRSMKRTRLKRYIREKVKDKRVKAIIEEIIDGQQI